MRSTSTVHWNRGSISQEHNERDEDLCSKEPHIDFYNEHGESFHETLYSSNLREKYEEIFGDAIAEYNTKQKRKDRRITIDDYMETVQNDDRGKRQTKRVNGKRVVDENAARRGKQLSYEITYKVGNTERLRDEDGRTVYDEKGHHVRTEWLPREVQQKALREYAETFQERNPNLIMVNANLHCDEGFYNKKGVWEYACDGLHIEVIPVASGFKQGLSLQNSLNKAMAEMGFKDKDCYSKWSEREQDYLAELSTKYYDEYCHSLDDEHVNFMLEHGDKVEFYHPVAEKTRQGGMDKEQYTKYQELTEREGDVARREKSVKVREDFVKGKEFSSSLKEKRLKAQEDEFDNEVSEMRTKYKEAVKTQTEASEAYTEASATIFNQESANMAAFMRTVLLDDGRSVYDLYEEEKSKREERLQKKVRKARTVSTEFEDLLRKAGYSDDMQFGE